MYIYAMIGFDGVIQFFSVESEPLSSEDYPEAILVDAVHEDWIGRKRWDYDTQVWENVLPSESNGSSSLQFTHIDANGVKHWLDEFVNDLAANAGGSVETATVSEVETYLGI